MQCCVFDYCAKIIFLINTIQRILVMCIAAFKRSSTLDNTSGNISYCEKYYFLKEKKQRQEQSNNTNATQKPASRTQWQNPVCSASRGFWREKALSVCTQICEDVTDASVFSWTLQRPFKLEKFKRHLCGLKDCPDETRLKCSARGKGEWIASVRVVTRALLSTAWTVPKGQAVHLQPLSLCNPTLREQKLKAGSYQEMGTQWFKLVP